MLSVTENLFLAMELQNLGMKRGFFISDEGGCYQNSKLVSSPQELGHRQGIELVRYDHSEPQAGKDMCDRILCPLKASIRKYCNEGHDVGFCLSLPEETLLAYKFCFPIRTS